MRRYEVLTGLCLALALASAALGKIIYVDDDANAPGDGKSWATAYRYLQDALADAKGTEKPVEIRVAQGVYKPDRGATQKAGNRLASFELTSGVALRGGYGGIAMSDPDARDIQQYETILSADLAGNDVLSEDPLDFVADPNDGNWGRPTVWNLVTESTRRENSVHVLVGGGTDQSAVLDGFTITGGNAYHPPYRLGRDVPLRFDDNDRAGAMLNQGGSPTLKSCTFIANSAMGGAGAVQNEGPCRPALRECLFQGNFSWGGTGAVENRDANVVMTDCVFERNDAWAGGASAMYSWNSDLSLAECRFTSNGFVGTSEGIVCTVRGRGTFTRCRFDRNRGYVALNNGQVEATLNACDFVGNSGTNGGGFHSGNGTRARLNNCRFVLNRAGQGGGLYVNYTNDIYLKNCLFYGNGATQEGGAIFCRYYGGVTATNTLFWANQSPVGPSISLEQGYNGSGPSTASISYSLIQGAQASIAADSNCTLFWGTGNISADPCFAGSGYWDPNDAPGNIDDDIFIEGDYHLKSQGGRWNPVDRTWVIDDATSPCIDAGDPNSPIGLEPFPNGGRINMGPEGGTEEASKSYFGGPPCENAIGGDINGDCRVDWEDLALLARHWLETN